jgi:tetratricopeptide (TPR) repeat protein
MRRIYCRAGAAALVLLLGAADSGVEQELWRHRNLGKALFENPTSVGQAPAELKKALDLAPDSFRDRLNYGLALLRAGELDAAVPVLEKAQSQDPSYPHAWFNLGIAYKRQMRYADAIRQFRKMIELIPDEPVSHYNLGLLYDLTGRGDEAIREFKTAAEIDPRLVAPRYQIFNYYRLHDSQRTAAALAEFKRVKEAQQEAGDAEDMEWSYYAELYDPVASLPAVRRETTTPAPKFSNQKLAGAVDASTAGMLVLDAGGARQDLLVWSRTGVRLYRNGLTPVAQPALGALRDVISIAVGDYDNDGAADLCVITAKGASLFRNMKGIFQPAGPRLPGGKFDTAVWLDFDHDYDLDLLLLGEKPVLLRNEGAGGLREYSSHLPFAAGKPLSAVTLRVLPDSKGVDLAVAYADHAGVLYRDRLRGEFEASPLEAIPAGASEMRAVDANNDGSMDLAFRAPGGGAALAVNRGGKFESLKFDVAGAFTFADIENSGYRDLVAGGQLRRNQGQLKFAAPQALAGLPEAVRCVSADFNQDGRLDLATVGSDGAVRRHLNQTGGGGWLRVALDGVKNLKSAAGAEVEVKAGDLYQKEIYRGTPLMFGLGSHKQADTVRVTWENGLIQNEMNRPAGTLARIREAPRLSGSCPMVFTWNGRGFEFITDVLGVAPLGASSGDGDYFPVDHDEYVQIPGEALKAADGRYQVRITEELHEVSYIDQVKLIALDHPASTEVFTNEKFKSPPFPEFRLYGVRRRISPAAARDGAGHDLLSSVLKRDRRYAGGFRHDAAGAAELHSLTLDFGKAAPDNRAVLLLNGWVDWADGSTFYGASQSPGAGLVFPYLQVKDAGGNWKTVIADMGIPAGKPKTIAVDLTGRFLTASREVRIVTNLCVYWDEIFLSESSSPEVRMTGAEPQRAELGLRGFSRAVIDARRERPEAFDYARWTPAAAWNQTPGLYTRCGDVRELLAAVDDRFAIFGAGDELRLSFDANGLPPLPLGWKRDFLLYVDGWAKDADANTAHSQSVGPLPFHAMSRYPYPPGERYPDDPPHRAYLREYNTRPASRLVPPLMSRRSH